MKRLLQTVLLAIMVATSFAVISGCGTSDSSDSAVTDSSASTEKVAGDYLCESSATTYGQMLDDYDECSPSGELEYCLRTEFWCSEDVAAEECELSLEFHNRMVENFDDGIAETESVHEDDYSFTYMDPDGVERTASCEATTT